MEASTKIKEQSPHLWMDSGTPRHVVHPILQQKCLDFLEKHLKDNNK
jgi:hypothetical protein